MPRSRGHGSQEAIGNVYLAITDRSPDAITLARCLLSNGTNYFVAGEVGNGLARAYAARAAAHERMGDQEAAARDREQQHHYERMVVPEAEQAGEGAKEDR